jgi:catechol 2,3-dioxygenase-like lactoylglutathione lyase family enzyme
MATASVRYIVDDVDVAIDFYRDRLGFAEVMHPAPTFAMLGHGDLRFILSAPGGRQIIVEDPSGNPIELFQPTIEARLS